MLGDGQTQHQHQICRLQARKLEQSVCLGVLSIAHIPPFHPEVFLCKLQTAALVLHDTYLVWDVFEGTSLQSYVLNSFPIHACLVPEACYHTPDGAK